MVVAVEVSRQPLLWPSDTQRPNRVIGAHTGLFPKPLVGPAVQNDFTRSGYRRVTVRGVLTGSVLLLAFFFGLPAAEDQAQQSTNLGTAFRTPQPNHSHDKEDGVYRLNSGI